MALEPTGLSPQAAIHRAALKYLDDASGGETLAELLGDILSELQEHKVLLTQIEANTNTNP